MKKLKFLVLILISILMLCSCGIDRHNEDDMGYEDNPVSSINIDEEEAAALNEKLPVVLYFGDAEKSKLVKEIRYIDIKEAKKVPKPLPQPSLRNCLRAQNLKALQQ